MVTQYSDLQDLFIIYRDQSIVAVLIEEDNNADAFYYKDSKIPYLTSAEILNGQHLLFRQSEFERCIESHGLLSSMHMHKQWSSSLQDPWLKKFCFQCCEHLK